jgi:hypothetical protein
LRKGPSGEADISRIASLEERTGKCQAGLSGANEASVGREEVKGALFGEPRGTAW